MDERWRSFILKAHGYLTAQQHRLDVEFGFGDFERYQWSLETGKIVFSTAGSPGFEADMLFVGSLSKKQGTWLWAWDNWSMPARLWKGLEVVRQFGEDQGFDRLVQAEWPGGLVEGWEMTSASAYLLDAKGAYRCPDDRGALYMLFKKVSRVH